MSRISQYKYLDLLDFIPIGMLQHLDNIYWSFGDKAKDLRRSYLLTHFDNNPIIKADLRGIFIK